VTRTYTLRDLTGSSSVSLVSVTGIIAKQKGLSRTRLDADMLASSDPDMRGQIVESYTLNLIGSSHDNAASQAQTFVRLLKKAAQYFREPWQNEPVYLQVQTGTETNARYALVFGAQELNWPDFFAHPFELQSWIEEFGLSLIREAVWRAAPPGTLSGLSAIVQTASDGPASPTTVQIANHRDDVALTHIYTADVTPTTVELNPAIDAFISSKTPTVNSGTLGIIGAGEDNTDVDTWRSLLKFDLSGIPSNAVLSSAVLSLYVESDHSSNVRTFRVFRTKRAWTEAGCTWNKYDGTNNWDTAGGFHADDCEQTDIGTKSMAAAGETGYQAFTLTLASVQAMIPSGGWTNNGFLVKADTEADDMWRFISREGAGGTLPKLVITYTVTSYSANLYGTAAHALFPATATANDALYIGSNTAPWHHAVFQIGTAGDFSADLIVEYWNGSAWTTCPLDTLATVYPTGNEDELFKSTGQWVLNVGHLTAWATTTVNSVAAWWIRIRLNAVTTWTTSPANATTAIYAQKTPHVEVSASVLKGDVFPFLLMRMVNPYGGDDDEGFPNCSRIIIGAKSRNLTAFVSHLNCGTNGNPSGWTTTYGDDTTETTTDGVAPRGASARCTFATDSSLDVRVILTGDGKLGSWEGLYRVFLRCQQIGGAAGDCRVKLRVCLNSTATSDPKFDTRIATLGAADKGLEVVDLGELKIAGVDVASVDGWGTLDLILQIYGQRSSGASTLRFYDLILIPIDEYALTLDDPISNSATGSSALRGNTALEVDGGIIKNRTMKMLKSGASYYPLETWTRGGAAPGIEPLRQTRLYFLMMHFPAGGTWGTGPMIATLGMHLDFTLYAVPCYQALRGSD
jgi:hypothetical protein